MAGRGPTGCGCVPAWRTPRRWSTSSPLGRWGGERRVVACNAVPYHRADGQLAGWRGSARDVTDLLHARAQALARHEQSFEERLAHAAAQSGIGFAELDVVSGRMAFDAVACSNHGLPFPHPPYSAADWLGAVHEADRAQATEALNEALARSGHMEARYRFVRPDGSQPWLEVIASVRHDEAGRPTVVTGTCRDVTVQVVAERLRQEKDAAERASQAKSEVVARVSHELRTPLNAILGLAQLMALDGDHLSSAQRTRVAGIEDAGRRLLALVNDMLDVARLEQGAQTLASDRVDLAEAWHRVVALVQPLATPRRVVLAPWPSGPRWALADARAVEQVLINLLSNAIKYNREGGRVWVEVDAAGMALPSPADMLRLTLCDEGQGLDADQLAQLFQPFNRLGAERQRIEGTGLGLVIARKLAEAMLGRLEATSRPGEGSRFTLSLPAAAAQA